MDVKIEESWKAVLREEFDKEYFSRIAAFLHQENTVCLSRFRTE